MRPLSQRPSSSMPTCVAESGGVVTMATIKNTFLEFVSPAEDDATCSSSLRRTNSSPCLISTPPRTPPRAGPRPRTTTTTRPGPTRAGATRRASGRLPRTIRGRPTRTFPQASWGARRSASSATSSRSRACPAGRRTCASTAPLRPRPRPRRRSRAVEPHLACPPPPPPPPPPRPPPSPRAEVGAPQSDPRPPASPGRAVAAVPGAPVQEKAVDHEVTPQGSTVMLKALPSQYTRDMLIELLQSKGFLQEHHCNFLYLPMNFKLSQNVGYAFLNLTCKEETKRFFDVFDGFSDWAVEWDQASTVWWSDTKGLNANIERYRNSPMMRDDVPDIFKPILLSGGKRISFPSPTKQHLPRIRCRKGHGIRVKMSQPDDSFGQ
ncbi:unnamed protein product [Prorocentrum cordatum]|uniref:Mei2-like C-terminal RNA recognition motif domain-containing protein n=1 Tax=Prorocentrum cordatum TaxID=2364126 RepID=A0ABN9T851_9DINO|nr:unnamed protein product [Polarella glacialis]